jgi:hypothetical protein
MTKRRPREPHLRRTRSDGSPRPFHDLISGQNRRRFHVRRRATRLLLEGSDRAGAQTTGALSWTSPSPGHARHSTDTRTTPPPGPISPPHSLNLPRSLIISSASALLRFCRAAWPAPPKPFRRPIVSLDRPWPNCSRPPRPPITWPSHPLRTPKLPPGLDVGIDSARPPIRDHRPEPPPPGRRLCSYCWADAAFDLGSLLAPLTPSVSHLAVSLRP